MKHYGPKIIVFDQNGNGKKSTQDALTSSVSTLYIKHPTLKLKEDDHLWKKVKQLIKSKDGNKDVNNNGDTKTIDTKVMDTNTIGSTTDHTKEEENKNSATAISTMVDTTVDSATTSSSVDTTKKEAKKKDDSKITIYLETFETTKQRQHNKGFVQDVLNAMPLMYKSCCNLCDDSKFVKMDYDLNQYPMVPFLNPSPLFLLEESMRIKMKNRMKNKMKNKIKNKIKNKNKNKNNKQSNNQLLKSHSETHGLPSSSSSSSGKMKAETSVNPTIAEDIAKKTCGCNLCSRSDQSKNGGGTTFKGPFGDPATTKDRWEHEAQGTKINPFNHRTDLPPPRQRKDLNAKNHHMDQQKMAGNMAAGGMASLGGLMRL